jgi:hypothetical protein
MMYTMKMCEGMHDASSSRMISVSIPISVILETAMRLSLLSVGKFVTRKTVADSYGCFLVSQTIVGRMAVSCVVTFPSDIDTMLIIFQA